VTDTINPTDVVAMAQAITKGVDLGGVALDQIEKLETHTWTPGAACPMRSRNRKVGSLTSIYDLGHKDNTITPPADMAGMAWLARCETHHADFYSPAFGPAWKARNRPWTFCDECSTIWEQRYGAGSSKKAVVRGKKLNTVAVAPPKQPKAEQAPEPPQEAPQTLVANPDDPEEAVWNEWSERLKVQAPAGGRIDWISDYHYQVVLPDGRFIDLRVHKGEGIFKYREPTGHDIYTDNLPAMLAQIG
jgi:hypothetical protein